jgi:hypothetical protein
MDTRKILVILALMVLVISSLLLLTGCPGHIDSQYGVKVAGDGNGGAFAVYEDELGGLVYAQKISPDGKSFWLGKGFRLVETQSQFYNFPFIQVISDDSGGIITAMPSTPSSIEPEDNYYIFRIDSGTDVGFLASDARIDQIVSDGSGGVIFDYSPDKTGIYIGRVGPDGGLPWGRHGVLLDHSGNSRRIAGDGLGGAVIVREELHYPEARRDVFQPSYLCAENRYGWGFCLGRGRYLALLYPGRSLFRYFTDNRRWSRWSYHRLASTALGKD